MLDKFQAAVHRGITMNKRIKEETRVELDGLLILVFQSFDGYRQGILFSFSSTQFSKRKVCDVKKGG